MRIYTSYFANRSVINPVSISRFNPSWYTGASYKKLAPSVELLTGYKKGFITQREYCSIYNEQLSKLDPEHVVLDLSMMFSEVCLVCYEKPGDFCHRKLVSEWLKTTLDITVSEFGITGLKKLW